jgi:hypothetical protein
MLLEVVHHRLSVAVRVDDHFTSTPVAEELRVELETLERGVPTRAGNGHRHDDGTYRWANLADGPRLIHVSSPSGRWVAWEPAPLVTLPLADRRAPVVIQVWPTPNAMVPAGVTAVRGTLIGTGIGSGQRVEIESLETPARGHFTRTDSRGDFLFLLPGWLEAYPRIEPEDPDEPDVPPVPNLGVELEVRVPGRTVTGIEIVVGGTATLFTGSKVFVPPGRETRARIHLS